MLFLFECGCPSFKLTLSEIPFRLRWSWISLRYQTTKIEPIVKLTRGGWQWSSPQGGGYLYRAVSPYTVDVKGVRMVGNPVQGHVMVRVRPCSELQNRCEKNFRDASLE